MLFSSTTFLFVFLPIVCIVYLLIAKNLRNYWLLLASLLFYAWGEPRYLAIMLLVILLNYLATGMFEKFLSMKKHILVSCVVLNLSILIFFKYTNFIIENLNYIMPYKFSPLHVVMPIGISFFIFQAISYTVDVYRGDVQCQKDIRKLALYVSLFPQLIAGPIVKYHDIEKNIDSRTVTMEDIVYGVRRFIIGLAKKVLLANTMGSLADKVYQTGPDGITMSIAWIGAVAYSLQIFFDFSGYSDMAIGIGRIFGFRFLENFNYPYIAISMSDFWHRWHISLSSWFKQYLYIPLGGNRINKVRTLVNLFVVFLATGIWHGASWNFIAWGLWHGLFVILEKRFKSISFNGIIGHIYVVLVFVIGWVMFRADNLQVAKEYIGVMVGFKQSIAYFDLSYYVTNKHILVGIIALLFCFPWNWENLKAKAVGEALYNISLIMLLVLSIMSIASSTYNPFIYFRF